MASEIAPEVGSPEYERARKALNVVAVTMAEEMAFLWERWEDHKRHARGYTPTFRGAMYDDTIKTACSLIRSLDSRMGKSLETLVVRLARKRWGEGEDRLPTKLYSTAIEDPDLLSQQQLKQKQRYLDLSPLPVVISTLDPKEVARQAQDLTRRLEAGHRSSPGLKDT